MMMRDKKIYSESKITSRARSLKRRSRISLRFFFFFVQRNLRTQPRCACVRLLNARYTRICVGTLFSPSHCFYGCVSYQCESFETLANLHDKVIFFLHLVHKWLPLFQMYNIYFSLNFIQIHLNIIRIGHSGGG